MRMRGGLQIAIGELIVRADEADVNGLTGEMALRGNVESEPRELEYVTCSVAGTSVTTLVFAGVACSRVPRPSSPRRRHDRGSIARCRTGMFLDARCRVQ